MEWELVKPWVNRVGIVLEFLSFWLAASEILGEERLRALERRVEVGARLLSTSKAAVAAATVVAGMSGVVLWKALPDWKAALVAGIVAAGVIGAMMGAVLSAWKGAAIAAMLMSAVLYLVLFEALPAQKVTVIVGFAAWVAALGLSLLAFELQQRLVEPLLRTLADDTRIRQRSLAVGAVLFVVGFLLQLIATF